ncbi:MAG: DinB family protein [Terriglobales bacterium]
MSLAFVNELFNYNYWARDRVLQSCATLTGEQFLRPLGNSFPSIRDTLAHLVAAEWIWLERWRGRSPRALLSAEEFPTLASVSERWRMVEAEMRAYLATLSEETLESTVTYVNSKGETWTYDLWRMMVHLLNHQSYHRGQVATLLRQLGMKPLTVDFLVAYDLGLRP